MLVGAAHELAVAEGTAPDVNELADLALEEASLLAEFPGDSPFLTGQQVRRAG